MVNEKKITCIICPIGCEILVELDDEECRIIEGSKCKRGEKYATNEALSPKRMLTTSVLVENGVLPLVSVKSSKPVPKEKLFHVLKETKKIAMNAPVNSGQTIIKNATNTGIDIIATKTVREINKN